MSRQVYYHYNYSPVTFRRLLRGFLGRRIRIGLTAGRFMRGRVIAISPRFLTFSIRPGRVAYIPIRTIGTIFV